VQESISRIRRQGQVIDLESHAAKMNTDQSRHEEIRNLITRSRPAPVAKLPYFQIPLNQNSAFFGRSSELTHCTKVLAAPNNTHVPKTFVLHGIPGVGKTSVALAFACREKTRCQFILWLASDDVTKLARGFTYAAAGLGLHQENASAEEDREAVKRWLGSTSMSFSLRSVPTFASQPNRASICRYFCLRVVTNELWMLKPNRGSWCLTTWTMASCSTTLSHE
jgi:hypothetical protein